MSTTATPRRQPMDDRIRQRRRAVYREQVRRRRRAVLSIVAVVALGFGGVMVARSPLFEIADVQVRGVRGERAAQVRAVSALAPGQNLLTADLQGTESRVADLAWVKGVDADRVPPSTVRISVSLRVAAATVTAGGKPWIVDAQGFVLSHGARNGLITIDAQASVVPPVGERISDAAVRNALAVHAALPDALRSRVQRYDAPSPRGLRVLLQVPEAGSQPEEVWVRFGLAEQVVAKARVASALIDRARRQAGGAESLGIAELDVRAPGNPVLIPAG